MEIMGKPTSIHPLIPKSEMWTWGAGFGEQFIVVWDGVKDRVYSYEWTPGHPPQMGAGVLVVPPLQPK